MGTADLPDTVVHAWLAELLTNPAWGVLQYAKITAHKAIVDIAELHRAAASGDMPPAAWDAADCAARATSTTGRAAGRYAVWAAYESIPVVDTHPRLKVDEVIVHALNSHALAAKGAKASRIVEVTRGAIRSWRHLAGLHNAGDVSQAPLETLAA